VSASVALPPRRRRCRAPDRDPARSDASERRDFVERGVERGGALGGGDELGAERLLRLLERPRRVCARSRSLRPLRRGARGGGRARCAHGRPRAWMVDGRGGGCAGRDLRPGHRRSRGREPALRSPALGRQARPSERAGTADRHALPHRADVDDEVAHGCSSNRICRSPNERGDIATRMRLPTGVEPS
jgi:hypothetical protein